VKQCLLYVVTPLATELKQPVPHAVYTLQLCVIFSKVKVKQSGRSKQLRKHSPMWFAINVLLIGTLSFTLKPTIFSNVNLGHSWNTKQNIWSIIQTFRYMFEFTIKTLLTLNGIYVCWHLHCLHTLPLKCLINLVKHWYLDCKRKIGLRFQLYK